MTKEATPQTVYLKDYQPPAYRTERTILAFDLREGRTTVRSRLYVRRSPEAAQDAPLVLNGQDLELLSLALDGRPLSHNEYQVDDAQLRIHALPEAFTLDVATRIKPEENSALEGLYRSGGMYCTQCEAQGFRKITYYQDRPDVLSRFTTTITADAQRFPVLLANGNLVADSQDGGRRTVTWQDPFPKPAYLFALVAGDLACMKDHFTTKSGRRVALEIYSEPHNIAQCGYALGALQRAMRWDEQKFGREYDLDIYMIVAVEDFNMGAMENKGLNVFNTDCVLASPDTAVDAAYKRVEGVIAHEYFHNWSGNRVTCRDWFQLSLKEGFTVFRDAQFSSDMHSRPVKRIEDIALLRSRQFAEDSGPMAHSVRPDSYMQISNFYTATVYEKGAEVVGMIRRLVGAAGFRAGCDLYFERHDGQAVTTEDFVAAMEDANGADLRQFRLWYSQAGTPVLAVETTWRDGVFTIDIGQTCPSTPGQPNKQPMQIPVLIGLLGPDGDDLIDPANESECCVLDGSPATASEGRPADLGRHSAPDDSPSLPGRRPALRFVSDAHIATRANSLLIDLRKDKSRLQVHGLGGRPQLSFLRGFSAPVRVRHRRSAESLAFLARHDSDGFARWDAMQTLLLDELQRLQQGAAVRPLLIELFSSLVADASAAADAETGAMLHEMLHLPAEDYLFEQWDRVDVEALIGARDRLRASLAQQLADAWSGLYDATAATGPYRTDAGDMARRSLNNLALSYLARSGRADAHTRLKVHLEAADNLTDRLGALTEITDSASFPGREKVLAAFHDRWRHESLVVNQWLRVQAASPASDVDALRQLEAHEAFDARNPNKLRALYGAFGVRNNRNFHAADGAGYRFLAQRLAELDRANPQMASRLLTPLIGWRKFDPARQNLMRGALEDIRVQENLSKEVLEVVTKAFTKALAEADDS